MRSAHLLVLCCGVFLSTLAGCPGQGTQGTTTSSPPPPRGKSHAEFLRSSRPKRPADTVEKDQMTLHMIDIGQGQAILLEFPCGAVLVDTGGEYNESFDSRDALDSFLSSFFKRRPELDNTLSAVFISHPHIDHTRGIDTVIAKYGIENVITNGQNLDDLGGKPQMRLHGWVKEKNKARSGSVGFQAIQTEEIPPQGLTSEVIDPIEGCQASRVDPKLTVIWGQVHEEGYSDNANDHSVAVRVDFGKASALLTGDLEFHGLDHLNKKYGDKPALLDVDVYVVGHHGSKNATAPHLMKAMTPKIALISAGPYERNHDWTGRRFGHPNIKAINKLRDLNYGVSWYRDSKKVWIGISGAWKKERKEVFRQEAMNHAIYSTGWDGQIGVRMYDNGWLEVETAR